MANWLRHHIWQLGLGMLVLAGFVVGILALRNTPLEANPGMPEDQRVFWRWVGTINQGPEAALEAGLSLLETHPHLPLLYLRLADVCRDADAIDRCRDALRAAEPPDARIRLYREAALVRLLGPDRDDEAIQRWKQIAQDPALDPGLTRLIVERGFQDEQPAWFTEIEQGWKQQFEEDSTAIGVAFGLGYAAVRRSAWSVGEHLLNRVLTLAPDDPEAYRELGRIYYFTRQTDKLIQVLEAGLSAAVAAHDLEQELVFQGNLGLTLFVNNRDLKKSEASFNNAIEQSRVLARGSSEGINRQRLAQVYLRQNRYAEALAVLDSAEVLYRRHLPERLGEVLGLRGTVLHRLYRFSDAEAVLVQAVEVAERRGRFNNKVGALETLSRLQYDMGRYDASRENALEAVALAEQYDLKEHAIGVLTSLGQVERRLGNFEAAIAAYQRGLELAEQTKNKARFRNLVTRLGRVALDLQDANAAKTYFETMLSDLQQEGESFALAVAYEGLGRTYSQFNNYTETLRYYDLALAQLAPEETPQYHAQILIAKAHALMQVGSLEEAAAVLTDVRKVVEDKHLAYWVEARLGLVRLKQGAYEEALRFFQQAEAIEQELPNILLYRTVMYGQALAYAGLDRPRQAEAAFRKAIDLIEALRDNLDSSTHRAYFIQDKVEVYEAFATFLEEQGRSEEALYFTERARSRSLLDLLYTTQQGQAIDASQSTDRLIEMNRRMQAISEVLTEAEPATDGETEAEAEPATDGEETVYATTRTAQLRREYARSDSIYQQLQGTLTSKKRIYTFDPLRPDAIQAMLAANEALIVYDLRVVAGQEAAAISVAYVVLTDTVMTRRLTVRADAMAESVRFFRDQLNQIDGEAAARWEPAARRLYRELIAPVLEVLPASVTHLNLVPEGVLHYVPFAALLDADGRFLVERYTLSIAPSASILKLSRDRNPRRWRSMLLFANPNGRLPGSEKEVQAIASVGSAKRRHTLIGAEATRANLEKYAGEYDILHFATHGRFVVRNPWRSYLELHGGEVLSAEEIGQLDLDAYLVTLSACESALSGGLLADVPNGDEWVGLNQAFLAAGTPTVMASLWPIDDLVSSDFMIQFYEALGPNGKAFALATVQRHFIENPRTRHPFYWAPFSMIGDPL